MVKLNLIVEGGVYTENVSAETANNAEALRESLHKFFTRLLARDDVEITIFMGKGYRNAVKQFIEASTPIGLFVDSDLPPKDKYLWFDKLINNENINTNCYVEIPRHFSLIENPQESYSVFFMIQEMEAWFLKQPFCLDKWAQKEGYTKKETTNIAEHSILKNKNIEEISKPSEKLKIIMKRFFVKNKKAAKYGKLKTAPGLLDALNVTALISLDDELRRFYLFVNKPVPR